MDENILEPDYAGGLKCCSEKVTFNPEEIVFHEKCLKSRLTDIKQ